MARIAVVGAGLIGRKHVEVVRHAATLAAIVDPDPAAADLARAVGAAHHAELDDCLARGRLDGAIVATPNHLHLPQAAALIAAGVPVLVEKPLADTAAAAHRIAAQAEAAGVPVLVGHHRRHSPLTRAAKAAIDDGALGRIATVSGHFWLMKPDDYFDAEWRRRPGAGPTYINLIHDIDLMRHFCGEIVAVQAAEANAVRGFEVEDTAAVLLEFADGALGAVTLSDTVAAPWSWELTAGENPAYPRTGQACYMIGGTRGSLSVPDLRLWRHPGAQSWWAPIEAATLPAAPADPVALQFRHFLRVIDGTEAPRVPATEGARNIEVLDAIKAAARDGGRRIVGAATAGG